MEEDTLVDKEDATVGAKAELNALSGNNSLETSSNNSRSNDESEKLSNLNSNLKNSENLESSESILSSINEQCRQIELKEKENGIRSDSECSSDAIIKQGGKETEKNCEIDPSSEQVQSVGSDNDGKEDEVNSLEKANGSNSSNCENSLDPSCNDKDEETESFGKSLVEENTNDVDMSDEKMEEEKENLAECKDEENSRDDNDDKDNEKDSFTPSEANESNDAEKSENNSENSGIGKIKIKLRSLASLCENDAEQKENDLVSENSQFEVSGVAVGDIVQHNNYVESDESGVMHLKISNVVGGEDCITGINVDEGGDCLLPLQISSISSLIEPLSPEGDQSKVDGPESSADDPSSVSEAVKDKINEPECSLSNEKDLNENSVCAKDEIIVNVFKSPLLVAHTCIQCHKNVVCEFRMVVRENSENKVSFLCSSKCKNNAVSNLSEKQVLQKPRQHFERVCGTCGKEIGECPKTNTLCWQTREFCNKLCLADHIGEVARTCYFCKANVRVLYMVKYCVRFGSDIHQFCCNTCLENFKATIKVCSFCQKNLNHVRKVISPSNKEYCSNKCLKRAQRRDIGQINYREENDCTVCNKKMINKFEFLNNGITTFLCSNPCLNVFKYVNQVKTVNCCLCARLLNAEETSSYFYNGNQLRVFCSDSCLSVFFISARKIVVCNYCKVKKYNFDMICSKSEELGEFFCCSVCCLNLVMSQKAGSQDEDEHPVQEKIEESIPTSISSNATSQPSSVPKSAAATPGTSTTPSTPVLKNCNMCSKLEPAQFHMVMSDSTLRSFCSYVCATRYKGTFGFHVSGGLNTLDEKPDIKPVDTSQPVKTTVNSEVQTKTTPVNIISNKSHQKMDIKDAKSLMRLFCPPHLSNKSTSCRPIQNTKSIQCRPHQWHKSTQTDIEERAVIPVPIPAYVPTPMMMYSSPTPVPLIVPVPVPIPIFIPTTEKTTQELEEKIKAIVQDFASKAEETKADEAEVKEPIRENEEDGEEIDQQLRVMKRKFEEENEIGLLENEHEGITSEIDVIGRIEERLQKHLINAVKGDSLTSGNSEGVKRKAESDEESSPKRRKFDSDEDAAEEGNNEVLDLVIGLSVWDTWVQRKLMEDAELYQPLQEDLSSMTSEELNNHLIHFIEDLSAFSSRYDVDTIFYILLGLQKYLFEKGSTHCIFLELNFEEFTSVFEIMVDKFFSAVAQPETKCLQGTRVTEEMLWEARQLGAHTPHVLINTLFYFNTKIFKLKRAIDHYNLTFAQISKEGKRASVSPGSLIMYLKHNEDTNLPEEENNHPDLMFENKDNPLRCPVKLYEFYLSKCPLSIRTEKTTYYVYPELTCLPDSPVWYSTKTIDVQTIEKMLNRILLVKEVQESLFGH